MPRILFRVPSFFLYGTSGSVARSFRNAHPLLLSFNSQTSALFSHKTTGKSTALICNEFLIRHKHCWIQSHREVFLRKLIARFYSVAPEEEKDAVDEAAFVCKILKDKTTAEERGSALKRSGLEFSSELVMRVLTHFENDWKTAMFFFRWVAQREDYSHTTETYNLILDTLGKRRLFQTMWQLVEEMHNRENLPSLVTDDTLSIVIRRYAAAHMVEQAKEAFYKRKDFGLELNTKAFQVLLCALSNCKHVQEAEDLLNLKKREFPPDTKSRNIILNGWCTRANVQEAKRYWGDLVREKHCLDLISYSIFINALTKKGKLHHALQLFETMWEKGINPDAKICNRIIDALCFKKRIPEALKIVEDMKKSGCDPDVATYNSLIKYMCAIGRLDKANELFEEMKQAGCAPNVLTYHYFLKAAETPEEVERLLERMMSSGCMPISDTYNLLLKAYANWEKWDRVQELWNEMERRGMGPNEASYTLMIHGLFEKRRFHEAYSYYKEMTDKGILLQPQTNILVKALEHKFDKISQNVEREAKQIRSQFESRVHDDRHIIERGNRCQFREKSYEDKESTQQLIRTQGDGKEIEEKRRRVFLSRRKDSGEELEHRRSRSKPKSLAAEAKSLQKNQKILSPTMLKFVEAMQGR